MTKLQAMIKNTAVTTFSLIIGFIVVAFFLRLSTYFLEMRVGHRSPDSLIPADFLKKGVSNVAFGGGGGCSGVCGQCDL